MCSPPRKPEQEFLIIEKAQEGLEERESKEICVCSDARVDEKDLAGRSLLVDFLGTPCRVRLPALKKSTGGDSSSRASVFFEESGEELPLKERILALYYLKTATGTSVYQNHITFRELKGSGFYYPIFQKRTGYLLKCFEGKEDLLAGVAPKLGGSMISLGDTSVEFRVFPRVPISLVLWKGDEEFPPKQSILFDESVSDYLPTECIVVATEILLKKVVALLK